MGTDASLRCVLVLGMLIGVAALCDANAMIAPFCASCALLVLLPQAPFSQARTVVLAHAVCIGIGAAAAQLPLPASLAALAAAWLSIAGMAALRAIHAPAVAHTAILALGKQPVLRYALLASAMALAFALYAAHTNARSHQP